MHGLVFKISIFYWQDQPGIDEPQCGLNARCSAHLRATSIQEFTTSGMVAPESGASQVTAVRSRFAPRQFIRHIKINPSVVNTIPCLSRLPSSANWHPKVTWPTTSSYQSIRSRRFWTESCQPTLPATTRQHGGAVTPCSRSEDDGPRTIQQGSTSRSETRTPQFTPAAEHTKGRAPIVVTRVVFPRSFGTQPQ